jgi:hypothetical protein
MLPLAIILFLLVCLLLLRYPTMGLVVLILLIALMLLRPNNVLTGVEAANEADAAVVTGEITEEASVPAALLYNPPPEECDGDVDATPQKPMPASASSMVVLESDPLPTPGLVDRQCEAQWFPRGQQRNLKEQQRDDFSLHRSLRRDHEWGDTRTWSAEDKAKYERGRSRMEADIAAALKPDRYMIAEIDPDRDYNFSTDQPFPSVTSDSQVFHTAHFRVKSTNTGDFANLLRTVI